jgi:hypothetical protein
MAIVIRRKRNRDYTNDSYFYNEEVRYTMYKRFYLSHSFLLRQLQEDVDPAYCIASRFVVRLPAELVSHVLEFLPKKKIIHNWRIASNQRVDPVSDMEFFAGSFMRRLLPYFYYPRQVGRIAQGIDSLFALQPLSG